MVNLMQKMLGDRTHKAGSLVVEEPKIDKKLTVPPYGYEGSAARYRQWLAKVDRPIEYLTPRAIVPFASDLPPCMMAAEARFDADQAQKISAIGDWGYYFYLGGGISNLNTSAELKPHQRESKFRSLHRLRAIGAGLPTLLGDAFACSSVLDMACNWGAFSLEMAARGAASVRGVDLRTENIDKANALLRYTAIPNVNYDIGDVFSIDGSYDVVLNLGLMYHVTQQYELVKKTYDLCNKVAVIETIVHREPFSGFILGTGAAISAEHAAGAIRTELHPTYRALLDLMDIVGFKDLIELDAEPDPAWVTYANSPFGNKTRRIIVGFK